AIWQAASGTKEPVPEAKFARVDRVAFSPDGKQLAAVSDEQLVIWNMSTGQAVLSTRGIQGGSPVTFHPSGRRIAGIEGETIKIIDLATGRSVSRFSRFECSREGITSLTFLPGGDLLVSAGPGGATRIWDPGTGEQLFTLRAHREQITGLALPPDGSE